MFVARCGLLTLIFLQDSQGVGKNVLFSFYNHPLADNNPDFSSYH